MMTMDEFFSRAGEIVATGIEVQGESPTRQFIAVWMHQHGVARFDGKNWSFKIFEVA